MDILDLIENVKKEYVNKTRRSQELYDELKNIHHMVCIVIGVFGIHTRCL